MWDNASMHPVLGPDFIFVYPPLSFFSAGNGWGAPKTIGGHKKHGQGNGGGPSPTASPAPTHWPRNERRGQLPSWPRACAAARRPAGRPATLGVAGFMT